MRAFFSPATVLASLLTALTLPAVYAQQVDGSNVVYVEFVSDDGAETFGWIQELQPGVWGEFNDAEGLRFTFDEQGRDAWSVYLFDPSRGTELQLDLFDDVVRIGPRNDNSFLYAIGTVASADFTEVDERFYYRLTNLFLGPDRALDTFGSEPNTPFMGDTGSFSGQFWRFTALGGGYYRMTNQFLGTDRSLDTFGSAPNELFMGNTGNFSGQFWRLRPLNPGTFRISNQFLGTDRSLDTFGSAPNEPFMGDTGNLTGQVWKLTRLSAVPEGGQGETPPFSGTIFIDPNIITDRDPTAFAGMTYAGQATRTMYDRRVDAWITVNAYLFDATFDDGLTTEIQVNPEFGSPEAARAEAETYAPAIGRIPTALRTDARTVWIHRGVEPFGGGNNNLLIHTGQGERYIADGILEETFVHEGAHTSLDARHAMTPEWIAAQEADPTFISTYARDFPTREDIAESFLPYLAVRYRADRISPALFETISGTIPNRIGYFDLQSFDLYPIEPASTANAPSAPDPSASLEAYPNPFGATTRLAYTLPMAQEASLIVYDLLGREVAVLAEGAQPAGTREATFDATGLASGVYVVRLTAESQTLTRRVVVMR